MIGLLQGVVDTGCVVTGCGVGYLVHTPTPLTDGEQVRLLVHQVDSETSSTLYGFTFPSERDVFVALCKVPGVAGRTALALLSDVGVAGIAAAVATRDAKALTPARGVGPKLAAKIVTMTTLPDELDVEVAGGADELTAALVGLGYPAADARDAAERTRTETAGLNLGVDRQLKVALAHVRSA